MKIPSLSLAETVQADITSIYGRKWVNQWQKQYLNGKQAIFVETFFTQRSTRMEYLLISLRVANFYLRVFLGHGIEKICVGGNPTFAIFFTSPQALFVK
jgi:hypothetical protein